MICTHILLVLALSFELKLNQLLTPYALYRHYILTGPPNTVYHGGFYHGKLLFTESFPYRPPGIVMLTPSGR
jgi:ubiquitin-protein ligase